jgi:hypothetical protein
MDPYLKLSDEIEVVIDDAQAHHLNGNLYACRTKLNEACSLVDKLTELERQSVAAQQTGDNDG